MNFGNDPFDLLGADIEMGHQAHRRALITEQDLPLLQKLPQGFMICRRRPDKYHIGCAFDTQVVDTCDALGKPPGVGMILRESLYIIIQRVNPAGRYDTRLTHTTTEHFA